MEKFDIDVMEFLSAWESTLIESIEGSRNSPTEKMRFFLHCFNESLARRTIELIRVAE